MCVIEKYLAHSERNGYPAQSYADHVKGTRDKALRMAKEMARYCARDEGQIENILKLAASYHDLGKLNEKNQEILHQKGEKRKHLQVNHADAGAAFIKQRYEDAVYSVILVYAHHHGLPDFQKEKNKSDDACFRDENLNVRRETDLELEQLVQIHQRLMPDRISNVSGYYEGDVAVFLRMVFSCLADADHSDTATAYGQMLKNDEVPELYPDLRLKALDNYVESLRGKEKSRRNELRTKMYEASKGYISKEGIVFHDGPVGSGKTTAIMAHQLRQASLKGARRIFVVLPYINIITQAVDVYRKALVLPGENPESVVAELHCKADFENEDIRYLNSLWKAPIIVTTAVAFFETLSSNRPGTLRRLHELPGSIIFIDEAHAALPIKLMPLAWHWMRILEEEWSCYWILASGSLVHFWEIPELVGTEKRQIPGIVHGNLRGDLLTYEKNRVRLRWNPRPLCRQELIDWVSKMPGPRLLIMNTVQSAAMIADDIRKRYGRTCVEHLSTALLPEDRAKTIEKVKRRLEDDTDTDWVLVATSSAETGVDFSFRTGFRELASLLSLLQAIGRVNRNGSAEEAEMWSFRMQDDPMLAGNEGVKISASVLEEYFKTGREITSELSTAAILDELSEGPSLKKAIRKLLGAENSWNFETVNKEFRVIASDTVPVIINDSLAEQIKRGRGNWQDIQKYSVSIYKDKLKKWKAEQIARELYQWTLPYDDFLGYMAGVLR